MLASIETDKAVVDFEMQEEGYVAAILFDEGSKDIPLGTAMAIIVDSKDDIAAFANYKAGDESASPAPAQEAAPTPQAAAAPSAPATNYPDHITLEMPNLSPTMEKVSSHWPL